MSSTVSTRSLGHGISREHLYSRIGDALLATVWTILSVASIAKTISEAPEENWLGTFHQAVSPLVLCVCAVLFIVRRPAKARNQTWRSRFAALAGTWMMPVVILLPLTWTSGWLLTLSTAGLVATHLVVFWSLLTLRRSFSIFAEARALITHGPYAIVRHPLYATYAAMYILLVLPRISVVAVVASVIGVACEVWRARNEEQVLRGTFPEYDEYASKTPRFIPRPEALVTLRTR